MRAALLPAAEPKPAHGHAPGGAAAGGSADVLLRLRRPVCVLWVTLFVHADIVLCVIDSWCHVAHAATSCAAAFIAPPVDAVSSRPAAALFADLPTPHRSSPHLLHGQLHVNSVCALRQGSCLLLCPTEISESRHRLTYLLMIWTNGVGASTGMFVPALAIGATGGRMFGRVVKMLVR